ncbi:MAG: CoA transferase subunit A [Bacteroidales bacterium]|jgi:acetate CoA/acetoacetate CoA-transferase alpha subunit
MAKIITAEQAASMVKDGMTIMFGGFLACGTPQKIVDAIAKSGVKNLTIIGNDTAFPDRGIGILVANKQVKKVIASHIGTNPNTIELMNNKEMEVELCPQGSLAERIRAGGAGLGGVLTKTGLNTIVQEGKEIINIDGEDFLLEKPLRADIAIVGASVGDKKGNLVYKGTTQNFNPLIATAADVVIAEVEDLKEVGEINPEYVKTQGILVDYIVKG